MENFNQSYKEYRTLMIERGLSDTKYSDSEIINIDPMLYMTWDELEQKGLTGELYQKNPQIYAFHHNRKFGRYGIEHVDQPTQEYLLGSYTRWVIYRCLQLSMNDFGNNEFYINAELSKVDKQAFLYKVGKEKQVPAVMVGKLKEMEIFALCDLPTSQTRF